MKCKGRGREQLFVFAQFTTYLSRKLFFTSTTKIIICFLVSVGSQLHDLTAVIITRTATTSCDGKICVPNFSFEGKVDPMRVIVCRRNVSSFFSLSIQLLTSMMIKNTPIEFFQFSQKTTL